MTLRDDIRALDAVIFDLDGTLINSPGVYYEVVKAAFKKVGLPPVSRKTLYHAASDGDFHWDEVLPAVTTDRKEALIEELRAVMMAISPRFFVKDLRMIDGAVESLKQIAEAGLKIGLVTSTRLKLLENKLAPLRKCGVEGIFGAVVTPDDVPEKKPDPEPLRVCTKDLGVSTKKTAYVGDTRGDIQAGRSAGMKTIAVLTGFATRTALKEEGPDLILESVAGLRVLEQTLTF